MADTFTPAPPMVARWIGRTRMADEKKQPEAPPPDPGWPEYKLPKVEMEKKPVIAPDGHVNLSQEDIDARQ